MQTNMILGDGIKYTYNIDADRFTELNGITVSNGNVLLQSEDKIYTYKGTGYIDIGNQNPSQLDFQNNNISNLNILFSDINIAKFTPKNNGNLGDGYVYRQMINLSKYNIFRFQIM
jgi:hypothetical protein